MNKKGGEKKDVVTVTVFICSLLFNLFSFFIILFGLFLFPVCYRARAIVLCTLCPRVVCPYRTGRIFCIACMTPGENYNRSYEEGIQGAVVDGDWDDRDATVRTKTMGRGKGGVGASTGMASTSTTTRTAATDGTGVNRNGNGKGKEESGDAEGGPDVERGENFGGGREGSSDSLGDGGGGNGRSGGGKSGGSGGVDETMTREVAFSRPPATPQQHQRTNERTPRDGPREYELESLGEHSREASSYVWRVLVSPPLFTIHIPIFSFLMQITSNLASANVVN